MSFIQSIVEKGKELNDQILNKDLDATVATFKGTNFKETVEKLQKDFQSAVYRGTYEAFILEKECEERLYM